MLSIAVGLSLMATALPASAASVTPMEFWEPRAGDELIVDIESNTGYLLHDDASYLPFIVATGQQKTVRYLGMTYYASTPLGSWVAKERKIQYDKVTFGKTGRFFRLFDEGTRYTHYGIHSYKYIDKWFQENDRYKSMGCIIVSEDILNLIEKTYEVNGKQLKVTTTFGPQKFLDELSLRESNFWF